MNRSRVVLAGVAIAAVLAVSWALRATWHAAPHSGGDNAAYVALADALLDGRGYTEVWDPAAPPHTKYPPVFPLALAAAIGLGATTWGALKGVPLLFGLVALAGTVGWGWRRRGPLWGVLAALLTGWSAAFLHYAHYLLSDVPFLAFTVVALWLVERRRSDEWGEVVGAPPPRSEEGDAAPAAPGSVAVAAALGVAGLAWFTRSAGLPLLVAIGLWLVLSKRWRAAAAGAVVLGLPSAWWLLRARNAVGDGAYDREFWMVNPYQPELGEIGLFGLVPRAVENAMGYLGGHLPAALTGSGEGVALAGIAVGFLALVGWGRAAAREIGPAELFAPLYTALILVWPVVWSGDRFVLPLVPLVIVYAGEALAWGVARFRADVAVPAMVTGVLVLLAVQGAGVAYAAGVSGDCRAAARVGGPWACSGIGMVQFTEAARWAGENVPEGSATLTRKPRIWYAMGGTPTRTYPFLADPDSLLAVAERAGATYVVLDGVAGQARLLAAAIAARPSAFCSVAGFGGAGGGLRTELLGILPSAGAAAVEGDQVTLAACPAAMRGSGAALTPYRSSMPIPILSSSPSP